MTNTTLLIGAPRGQPGSRIFNIPTYGGTGAAHIFKRNSRGNWAQTQKLTAVDNASGFGAAVAIDNGMIIVGAPKIDVQGGVNGPEENAAGGAAYGFLPVDPGDFRCIAGCPGQVTFYDIARFSQ